MSTVLEIAKVSNSFRPNGGDMNPQNICIFYRPEAHCRRALEAGLEIIDDHRFIFGCPAMWRMMGTEHDAGWTAASEAGTAFRAAITSSGDALGQDGDYSTTQTALCGL
jgi:hypothetical protein